VDEGRFTIREVLDDGIVVQGIRATDSATISLPLPILEHCTENMAISGVIARRDDPWKFLEVWNVYPE